MEAEEQIRRVVRGLAHWSSLRAHGFELDLQKSPGEWRWTSGSCPHQVPIRVEDVIEGILNLKSQPALLSEWAFFLIGSDSVNFDELDESPRDEALRDIIFGLSAEEPLEVLQDKLEVVLHKDD